MHVADDDTIIAEFDLLGTNLGPLLGAEPTGKAFRVPTIAVFSFDGELITNERVYLDLATMFHQIGRADLLDRGHQ
jgi:predicted ester cyclase